MVYLDWMTVFLVLAQQVMIGRKLWYGWLVMFGTNGLYAVMQIELNLKGQLLLTIVMSILAVKNMIDWKRSEYR